MFEPAIAGDVVQACTSPVRSDFRDSVARKLTSASRFTLNPAAARYAIDLTRSLGLLQDNLVWSNLGHVLSLICRDEQSTRDGRLSERQTYFFLRTFLEFDGAALIHFAKRIEEDGRVPPEPDEERWPGIAQRLFRDTYAEYLALATDPQDRVRIRQLDERRRSKPFSGNSGRHQCFVHLHTLYRLGLITRANGDGRAYTQSPPLHTGARPTTKLVDLLPGVLDLERAVSAGRLYDIVGELAGRTRCPDDMHTDAFEDTVRRLYRSVVSTGVSLCSLQTLTEAIQLESLVRGHKAPHAQDILNQLRLMQRNAPRDIRFHVDVFGRPAYLKIS